MTWWLLLMTRVSSVVLVVNHQINPIILYMSWNYQKEGGVCCVGVIEIKPTGSNLAPKSEKMGIKAEVALIRVINHNLSVDLIATCPTFFLDCLE